MEGIYPSILRSLAESYSDTVCEFVSLDTDTHKASSHMKYLWKPRQHVRTVAITHAQKDSHLEFVLSSGWL